MSRLKKLILSLAVFVALPVGAEEELVIYSGRSDKFVRPVMEAFTEQTGIQVVLHNAKATALLNKLRVEGPRTDADLFLSNDAGTLQTGADLGLFQPMPDELVSSVDPNLRARDNSWVGLSARARVLLAHRQAEGIGFVDSVLDLADPRLKGRIGITNSSNESFIAGVTVYMHAAGPQRTREWLEGLKKNAQGEVFAKHSKIVKAVAAGRKDIGLVNHYYIYRHLARHPNAPIRIILPDQDKEDMGVAWNVAGVAVSKYTDQPGLARKLVAFLVSEKGQRMFAESNREYPTRKGVPAADAVPPAGSYRVADVPMWLLGKDRVPTLNLIDEVGLP